MPGTNRTGNNHYDVAFLGDSLASLLSAALLVKRGCRVLMIHNTRELPIRWLTSSLLLERMLDLLDGRACCTTPAPFQVITRHQRIDCNGKSSLADELRRELPVEHREVATFLDDMLSLGEQLEDLLWEHRGLPSGRLGNRFRFRRNCFRADIPGRVFRQTLRDRLSDFGEPGARKFLTSLFCGFSFAPSNRLTLAECALIWSGLGRKGGIVKSGLEELLWHRYKQFHGAEEQLHRLARVRTGKDGSGKFLFDDERVATADRLVFADRETVPLCEGLSAPPTGRLVHGYVSANIKNRISPLLTRRVIVDGNPPLRLQIEETGNAAFCRVENAAIGERGLASTEQIEKRLTPVFPFVDLNLVAQNMENAADVDLRSDARPALMSAHERVVFDHGKRYLCSGSSVIPELGTVGEVIVALTTTNELLQATGKPPL